MALDQAKDKILAKEVEMALETKLVFADFSNRKYEKILAKAGDQVDILQVARPTITTTTDGAPITISAFEDIQSSKISMRVVQQSWFGDVYHDVDAAQISAQILSEITSGGGYGLADAMDFHISTVCAGGIKDNASATKIDKDTVLPLIDASLAKLFRNNVPINEELELVVTPRAAMVIKQALINTDTNNSDLLKRGIVAMYGNVAIKMSNNIRSANSGTLTAQGVQGTEDLLVLRSRRAVAFIEQINKIKTGEVEKGFGTFVKGLALYQAQLIQPKELIVLNVRYA